MGVNAAKWRGDLEEKLGYERLEWRKRTVAMCSFLSSEDKVVMDLGAGSMRVKGLLDSDVQYIPVDYKKTSPQTIVCDFNKHEFPDVHSDVIIASGILGYIDDPYWFLDKICEKTSKLIISYKGKEKYEGSLLYSSEIITYLAKKGFSITGQDKTLEEWNLIGCFEKITPFKLGKQISCTGCGACINSCAQNALVFDYDDEGFYKPKCETEKCVNCGKCTSICPLLNKREIPTRIQIPDVYAVWAQDDVRIESSSGGAFFVMASYVIKNGGCVFGAEWDDVYNCVIKCAENSDDIKKLMHSKYVQSDTRYIYRKVKEKINANKMVLYVGTPCQIVGLYSYLGDLNESDLLYTVDLVCFGVPSNLIFHKYLNEKYHIDEISDIVFRDKNAGEGWSPTGYGIYMKDGSVVHNNGKDNYQKAFHEVLFRNNVCENCTYYKLPRQGDFTFGDFWGIQVHDKTWNDGKGTSLVSVNSEKASSLWLIICKEFKRVQKVSEKWPQNKGNRFISNARAKHYNKEYFVELLEDKDFDSAVEMTLSDIHDIGIVCMMNYNIGNNLTNYALYQIISDMGYHPLMIDMPKDSKESAFYNENGPLFYFLKSPYRRGAIYKPNDFWELYEKDNCSMYILGSDQLWRSKFVESTDYFTTLNWSPSYKKKISYGTSLGTEIDMSNQKMVSTMKQLISRFDKVSVREKFAKKTLDELGISSSVVLDPVFLCPKKYFVKMANRGMLRIPEKEFVFGYFLDPDKRKEKFLLRLAKEKCNSTYVATTEPPAKDVKSDLLNYTLEICVEEWLAMVKEASFIVTDSFHGMCFALIFNKPFWVVYNRDNWRGVERFIDLLSMLGLQSHLVLDDSYIEIEDKINYEHLNNILTTMKNDSYAWLTSAIKVPRGEIKPYDSYDGYLEIKNSNRKHFLKLEEELRKIKSELFFASRTNMIGLNTRERKECSNMVVGWGAGYCFRKNQSIIEKYGNIKYICDSNPELWGTQLTESIICISPAELLKFQNPLVLIMVENAATSITIANSLLDMGITQYEHIDNWIKSLEIQCNRAEE